MIGDMSAKTAPESPCCSTWVEKCSKLEEGRKYLRQAVKVLTEQAEKMQSENVSLKKELEEERSRLEQKQEDNRLLENDITLLKSEIVLLRQKESAFEGKITEVDHLRNCISEGEKKIEELTKMVEKEKQRADMEKKKALEEKKSAAEARRQAKVEIARLDGERKVLSMEVKKADQHRMEVNELKRVAEEAKDMLASTRAELENVKQCLEIEKSKSLHFNACADDRPLEASARKIKLLQVQGEESGVDLKSDEVCNDAAHFILKEELMTEKAKTAKNEKFVKSLVKSVDKHKKRVEKYKTMAAEKKTLSDQLSNELKEDKLKNEELKKELSELLFLRSKFEPCAASFDKGIRPREQQMDVRQDSFNEYNVMCEGYLERGSKRRLVEGGMLMGMKEQSSVEELTLQLREDRKRMDDMQKQIAQLLSRSMAKESYVLPKDSHELKLLQRKLKHEKKISKHAKEKAKIEKDRNLILHKEFSHLKMEFLRMFGHLDMVSKFFCHGAGEAGDKEQVDRLKCLACGSIDAPASCQPCSQSKKETKKYKNTTIDVSDYIAPDLSVSYLSLWGQNAVESISGKDYSLEPIAEDNINKFIQSSAMNSSSASFSDDQLIGSQETGKNAILTSKVSHHTSKVHQQVSRTSGKHSENPVAHDYAANSGEILKVGRLPSDSIKEICPVASVDALGQETSRPLKNRNSLCEESLAQHSVLTDSKMYPNASDLLDADLVRHDPFFESYNELDGDNYMKMLELDDAAEEERYRRATEMPLSPLPEMLLPDIDMLISPEYVNIRKELPHEHNIFPLEITNLVEENNCPISLSEAIKGDAREDWKNEVLMTIRPIEISLCESKALSAEGDLKHSIDVFGDLKNSRSIHKITCAARNCIAELSTEDNLRINMRKILNVLNEDDLSPIEKVCFFVTIFVHLLSSRMNGDCFTMKHLHNVDAWSKEIKSVMQDQYTRNFIRKLFSVAELLAVESFLMHGQVVTYVCSPSITDKKLVLSDVIPQNFLHKSISVEQLLVGCIILATLCEATDSVDFTCQSSYNLLQSRRFDDKITLFILHIFAHLGEDRFLFSSKYTLEMMVIKSLVINLERENSEIAVMRTCGECPFLKDRVPSDIVVAMLLDRIHSVAIVGCGSLDRPHGACKPELDSDTYKPDIRLQMECNEMCDLIMLFGPSSEFCSLCDIFSLLELIASRMSWEWTSIAIIPELLEMLTVSKSENFIIGVLALLGHLGRIGVRCCGYEDKVVQTIRSKLSSFLFCKTTVKEPLLIQFTAVSSLLELMAIEFPKVSRNDLKSSLPASQDGLGSVEQISDWFSLLSEDEQTLALNMFQPVHRQSC